jgi:hypothetical protein
VEAGYIITIAGWPTPLRAAPRRRAPRSSRSCRTIPAVPWPAPPHAPSRGWCRAFPMPPLPQAAPTPRRLGARAVCCGRSPASARPAPRPDGSATWRASPIKGRTDPVCMQPIAVSPVRHRVPWALPPVNVAAAPSYDSVASPTPLLDPVEARPSPYCVVVPHTWPERAPPRPPPPGAAEGARRRYHRPNQGSKSSLGHPWTTQRPSPADPAVGARRNFTTRAGRRPENHIERPQFFLRANPQSKGIFVRSRTFPGTPVQKWISNSIAILQNLVNCVENRRKFRKMQAQFCWVRFERSYNFCYTCLS